MNVRLALTIAITAWVIGLWDAEGFDLKYALASVWFGVGIALIHKAWRS